MATNDAPNFRGFSTPFPHLAYSTEFFEMQTVAQAPDLLDTYPVILMMGSVTSVEFSSEVVQSSIGTVILPRELLPGIFDLHLITRVMEEEYCNNGMCSVKVTFKHEGIVYARQYSLSKATAICSDISNHLVQLCLTGLKASHFGLERKDFLSQPFHYISSTVFWAKIGLKK
ncbi:hypothetical protein H0H92_013040, partial [Tricholoma furcatifolium]